MPHLSPFSWFILPLLFMIFFLFMMINIFFSSFMNLPEFFVKDMDKKFYWNWS